MWFQGTGMKGKWNRWKESQSRIHWLGNNIALGLDLEGSVEPYEMCLWIVFEGGLASCVYPNAKQSYSLSEARRQGEVVQSCLRLVMIVVAAVRGQDLKWHMRGRRIHTFICSQWILKGRSATAYLIINFFKIRMVPKHGCPLSELSEKFLNGWCLSLALDYGFCMWGPPWTPISDIQAFSPLKDKCLQTLPSVLWETKHMPSLP